MARPTKGSITEHVGRDGLTYRSLRFTAYGKRRRVPLGPVSEADAESALRHALADVERGTWKQQTIEAPAEPTAVPTFHEFAEEWWTLAEGQLARKTQADYRWRLQVHLIPYFGGMALDQIKFATIEGYIAAKLSEADPLSARSINMTVTLLGAILERALKRELTTTNPARDKDLRVKERTPTRSYLDAAGQITALLDAAGELDRNASKGRTHIERRAMIATLAFAGLRIGELCALRWRDVDLAGGWLHVGESKTDAGRRRVKMRGALRDELLALRGRHQDVPQSAYVFATLSGGRLSPDNFRNRVLRAAVKLAGERLEADGLPPLPDKLTPHSLRRTFCSLLYALGEDPGVVMDEMGHTDPALALRVYRQSMRRGEDEKAQLRALVEGGVLANSGQRDENRVESPATGEAA
ncbi:MAG: tyrosine-type recombinase/integrase [Solirubrobacteraceae bacterium]